MKRLFFLFLIVSGLFACGDSGDDNPQPVDNFDRKAMLTHWADNIILPALEASFQSINELENAAGDFRGEATTENLEALQTAWLNAYKDWQRAGIYEIGEAEEVQLISLINLYPTDVDGIEANIAAGEYNLDLPSQKTRQGFPAMDYLLFGNGASNAETLTKYQDGTTGEAYREYLLDISEKMRQNLGTVLADWSAGYRQTFVDNDGNSATASTDRLVNDYIFYYEKHLRAGKVGIPAGVFSGNILPQNVEAFHRQDVSKELLLISLDAAQDFFNGVAHDGSSTGPSLASYLNELETSKNGQPLADVINAQFDEARSTIEGLGDNFVDIVNTNNIAMLEAYDALQLNVVNLKVDMLQALNINVDYVDADGD
ncbi:MAG: imelysin family protein [Bacteroidota bacterium]